MNKKQKNRYLLAATACLLVIVGLGYYYLFTSFVSSDSDTYIYIDNDDDIDSVTTKLGKTGTVHSMMAFRTMARHSRYATNIKAGCYIIKPGESTLSVFRRIKNGRQDPVRVTVPSVRTVERLSAELARKLLLDSTEIVTALTDEKVCAKYGYDTATIVCMFIPDTYDVYWTTTIDKFLDKMDSQCKRFWNQERMRKAELMHLTPQQVCTLASIVDEETNNTAEKPMIAGMYYNRLMLRNGEYPSGMPLQADPTIKFAWKQFGLRRIYNKLLYIQSPYNTYKNPGLPPGPIRVASQEGIDAVLNYVHHDYLYMCAKEDFSGTHNFARTYQEHMQNARKYSEALNKRGIQ